MKRDDLLDLNEVLQHPGHKLAVDISTELENEEEIDLVEPLEGFLEAVSSGNLLLITGEFKTKMVIECARCTSPVETTIEFEIDEQFPVEGIPSSYSSQDFARVVPDEPYPLFEENNLLVENLLRQGLLLAVPTQVLCTSSWDEPCPKAAENGTEYSKPSSVREEFEKLHGLIRPDDSEESGEND